MDPNELDAGIEPDALTAEETAILESGGERDIPEPAPIVEKAPDKEAQAAVEGVKQKMVPHETFHAEREEHKKTKAELSELREFRAAMDERMRWFEAAQQQPQKDDTPPDPNVDVFAALKWTQDKLLEQQTAANESRQRQEQQTQEQQREAQVWNYWQQDAATYTKENPDFGNAAKWLSDYRDKQLTAMSNVDARFTTPQARNAQIETELKGIIIAAAQQRKSPAQLVYELAKGYGYAAKAEPDGALNAGLDGLNARIDQLDKAQSANRTVGNAPGNAGGDEMTAEALANMPEQEFAVWMAKPENAAKFRKLMA
jgi:vacuolar-type H+-ATPase subunit I/STV1